MLLESADEVKLKELGYGPDGDRELVEAILAFTKLLLEKARNRLLYNSSDRLNDLLNTTSLSLLDSTLRVTLSLAHRHAERPIRIDKQAAPTQFFDYDHSKLQRLAAPVTALQTGGSKRPQMSPTKSFKGKDKLSQSTKPRRGSNAVNPNDFRSLCRDTTLANGATRSSSHPQSHEREWQSCAGIKVTWSQAEVPLTQVENSAAEMPPANEQPATPTPVRRQTSSLNPNTVSHEDQSEAQESMINATSSQEPRQFELSPNELLQTDIHRVLQQCPSDMPATTRYELLHKLRVAYGLVSSPETRKQILAIRLLAVASIGYAFKEFELPQKLFGGGQDPVQRQQLIQQTMSLLQETKKGQAHVPRHLETLALETIRILARHRSISPEIMGALGTTSTNGLLLRLTQKAVAEIAHDGDATDNLEGDDWRDAVFHLVSGITSPKDYHQRSSDSMVSTRLVSATIQALNCTTDKALRIHQRVFEFIKRFIHEFKDGLLALSSSQAFEAVSSLLGKLAESSWQQLQSGGGVPAEYKTHDNEYEIPYMPQQVIRLILALINDLNGHQGGQADRVLRSLVDSQPLLRAFRLIISQSQAFGAHTWAHVVKALAAFLHNEPTSFTVINEAGISKSFLDAVCLRDGSTAGSGDDDVASESDVSKQTPQGIPAHRDSILNAAEAFGAICLTNSGFEQFKSTGALEKFFEIFESPAHIKVLNLEEKPGTNKREQDLAALGGTFDELVRHHPGLRPAVLSAVVVMIARVRQIALTMAWRIGAGPKLYVQKGHEVSVSGGSEALLYDVVPYNAVVLRNQALPSYRITLPNGKVLAIMDEEPQLAPAAISGPKDHDEHDLTVIEYAKPALGFLWQFLENQSLCMSFMECGATDIILDFITLPSFPVGEEAMSMKSGFIHELADVVQRLAAAKPHLVLPVLVDRARHVCSELEDFQNSQPQGLGCYFKSFVVSSATQDEMEIEGPRTGLQTPMVGTRTVRNLSAVCALALIIGEVFHTPPFSPRSSHNNLLSQVNLTDVLVDLCAKFGKISAACSREEIALQCAVPEAWLKTTKPDSLTTGHHDVDQILRVGEDASQSGRERNNASPRDGTATSSKPSTSKEDKQTAAYRNVEILRFLLVATPKSITGFFGHLGRGITGRRRVETISKQKTHAMAQALAAAYVDQLQPKFFQLDGSEPKMLESRFSYFVVALSNVTNSLKDHYGQPNSQHAARQGYVLDAFRKSGGLELLTRIGEEFFDELKSCEIGQASFSANSGLKLCLEILDDMTNTKCIMESSQCSNMRNSDPGRPFYFVPAQALLELRMAALPLVRRIWESDYADQASNDIVQKLISVLKHVLSGDQENDAIQSSNGHPKVQTQPPKRFAIDPQKLTNLKEKGYTEDLAREALYRANVHPNSSTNIAAEEYCKAVQDNPRRRRLPVPSDEVETAPARPSSASGRVSLASRAADLLGNALGEEVVAESVAALAHALNDEDMEGMDAGPNNDQAQALGDTPETSVTATTTRHNAMDINNVLNDDESSDESVQDNAPAGTTTSIYSVEAMNVQRELIREDLVDRCNNILNNHQTLVFELSELIMSATKQLAPDSTRVYWENTSDLLVSSLLSMQVTDDMTEAKGQKVAAAAHLIALLIQDAEVFKKTIKVFQESFEGLISFLRLPAAQTRTSEDSYPWIAPVLLITERMLSRDSEPVEVTWEMPNDFETSNAPRLILSKVLDVEQKELLFSTLLDLLPRVGKDKKMALAVTRVLAMLSRHRAIAKLLGNRRNLQRLFLMIKQLASGVESSLMNSFMLVLRHVIEDEDTLKQIMRSEITALLSNRGSSRPMDLLSFTRDLSHLVVRSPELFVEVTAEHVKLTGWQPHASNHNLVLKDSEKKDEGETSSASQVADAHTSQAGPTPSVESAAPSEQAEKHGKGPEVKPPVVENPDGVIHFLLSEMLSYKDVEDKEVADSTTKPETSATKAQDSVAQNTTISGAGQDPSRPAAPKGEKPKLKIEEHPIFVYRIFLLQCLTELVYSYNRTKVEFINFSRKADPLVMTPSKPRSGVLNYLLNVLVPSGIVEDDNSLSARKKVDTSTWAKKAVVALCSKTGETGFAGSVRGYPSQLLVDDQDDEPDLAFVRRFVLEHAIRAFKEATASTEELQVKYSRLLCLADMFNQLLSKPQSEEGFAGGHNTSYKVLGRIMFEKNLISILTSSLADIDLSYTGAKRVIKFILRPLQELTNIATQLSLTSPELITSVLGHTEDDVISSASSVSELDDEREETPDLFRNSALGMLDPNRPQESDSEEEEDEDDEEMYDDGYEDEMEYDEGMPAADDGDVISDQEIEDDFEGTGPLEGLPGDVPMDIEVVVNEHGMDVDTEDDDEDDLSDEEDDDEDEDDEDDDHFEIDIEDGGEINGDDENDSLGEGHDGEEDWEDEDEDDDDQALDQDIAYEGDDIQMPTGSEEDPTPTEFNDLLRALGQHDVGGHGISTHLPPDMIVPASGLDDEGEEEEEDDDEDDDGEDMDENDDMGYDAFDNEMLDGDDDILDEHDHWGWDEPVRRRHVHGGRGVRMGFLDRPSRQIFEIGGRARNQPQNRRDDNANPLLQRPIEHRGSLPMHAPHSIIIPPGVSGIGLEGFPAFPPLEGPFQISTTIDLNSAEEFGPGGHGAILDQILQNIQHGSGILRNGRLHINMNDSHGLGDFMRTGMPGQSPRHGHQSKDESQRFMAFVPMSTSARWQNEVKLLFGNAHLDKIQRVQKLLMSKLVPPAQQEEKTRRKKREEDAKREREEMERQRVAKEERLRNEAEEREKAKAEAEARAREEAEAAAAAAAAAVDEAQQEGRGEPMEDVQSTEAGDSTAAASGEAAAPTPAAPRVFTTIRNRQVDITDLSIDHDYLEALPEDLREEVIMQQYAARREQTQDQGGEAAEIDEEFLNALPEEIREELRQQEAIAQRRRERETARRQAAPAGATQVDDMGSDDFLATLDPALRRAILAEQPLDILQQLHPTHAAEGRAHHHRMFHQDDSATGREGRDVRGQRDSIKDGRRQVVQLIDKAGVATLLRLMFVSLDTRRQMKKDLFNILRNVCGNRQTRFEVISLLLVILKEGSADVSAVERSLANLSLRAKATSVQKTPQPLKRTLSMQPHTGISEDMTPLLVIQQCLAALSALCQQGFHVKTMFLREVDVGQSAKDKKGKGKENKTTKYPINDVISLLERKIIMDSDSGLQSLSELLSAITSPLPLLLRKEKEKPEEKQIEQPKPIEQAQGATESQAEPTLAPAQDTAMLEAPAASEGIPVYNQVASSGEASANVEEGEQDESKTKKPFEPPVIPEHNLKLVTGIFVAQECNSQSFHNTLETLRSLSHLPGSSTIFGNELMHHVQTLALNIMSDLDEFLPLVKEATSSTDLQVISSSKFSSTSSDQVKLLRVLQALDYLSREQESIGNEDSVSVKAIFSSSHTDLSLASVWSKLGDCLTVIGEKDGPLSFATILLPLIESLMVVCKHTSLKDIPLTLQIKEQAPGTPGPEDMNELEKLFFRFTTDHRKILNDIVRQSPKLMQGSGSFSLLTRNPKILDFDNKRNFFNRQLHSRNHNDRSPQPPLQLNVRRDQVFMDSYKALYFKNAEEMKYGKLNIRFNGEEGVDAGGVTREWFQVLARGMFDPNWALWEPVAADRTTFHPSKLSWVNDQHLVYFKFIGRIIGKALHEGRVLDAHFSRAVYKRMLGKQPNLADLESMDLDYYKSLVWILENDITEVLTEDFSVVEEQFGEERVVDLIPDGHNIPVTEENKKEYVQKLVEYRLTVSVNEQLENFIKGFHDIIPAELVAVFNEKELELLISGLPEIDVDDWRANTEYHNYNASSPQVTWFWRIVRGMSQEDRAKLLQFVTGTSKVPLQGFSMLEGMNGELNSIDRLSSTNK